MIIITGIICFFAGSFITVIIMALMCAAADPDTCDDGFYLDPEMDQEEDGYENF